ncbi:hypothetical protein BV898_10485 [Hypsibius exemplaris]|uniref:Uncharacterized protein n=1 Tax=Hypsibius exemplaris TaxID=2072580 RepID=A0A1W0WJM5_HYPEX|nr:hypothetical protein BV898_10485 [Hypsibius exemplaris]
MHQLCVVALTALIIASGGLLSAISAFPMPREANEADQLLGRETRTPPICTPPATNCRSDSLINIRCHNFVYSKSGRIPYYVTAFCN